MRLKTFLSRVSSAANRPHSLCKFEVRFASCVWRASSVSTMAAAAAAAPHADAAEEVTATSAPGGAVEALLDPPALLTTEEAVDADGGADARLRSI